ncbi:hypothetical protein NLX86_02910 [Streptomyces sp. A3M-1-3]|uniref:hypothetical protein n=1 Tax=Streptomyces sp. A3M-1-3 TaxID=2962044 RepID=UPI0020B7BC9E|nr:hypothetical protein [Streptomyces sp. A3M-1-3]MCP3817124.1 hypothetical protein [Streptomyces sp. A3M-1-3]
MKPLLLIDIDGPLNPYGGPQASPAGGLRRAPAGTYWKTQYVLGYAAGRPFAWFDDEITMDRSHVDQKHLAAALLVHVDHRIGLTLPDFDALAYWAAALVA